MSFVQNNRYYTEYPDRSIFNKSMNIVRNYTLMISQEIFHMRNKENFY